MQFVDVITTVHQIDVQPLHRQRGDGVEVWRNAFKIGGQQQVNLTCERVISGFEGGEPFLR